MSSLDYQKKFFQFTITLSPLLYVWLGYCVQREQSVLLVTLLSLLFTLYFYYFKNEKCYNSLFWLGYAIFLRVLLLSSSPALSDDVYRYIWDGRLLYLGINPFQEIPSYYTSSTNQLTELSSQLFSYLNSKNYYSVYPPLTQYIFWISVVFTPNSILGSVIMLRCIILLAEIGTLLLIKKMLKQLGLPENRLLLYSLNPFIILELTGNLHFEVFVIFFLILSLYLILKTHYSLAAIAFAGAVNIKLLPLIFLPSLFYYIGFRKTLLFGAIVISSTLVILLPFSNTDFLTGMQESLLYYFKKFEFNASVYYLVREWGFWKYGYNIIESVGWKLAIASLGCILLLSFKNFLSDKNKKTALHLIKDWTLILFTYLLFTTIVHPWYIAPLILFTVFYRLNASLLWSVLIMLTYIGYTATSYAENYLLLFIEYVLVFSCLVIELYWQKIQGFSNSRTISSERI